MGYCRGFRGWYNEKHAMEYKNPNSNIYRGSGVEEQVAFLFCLLLLLKLMS